METTNIETIQKNYKKKPSTTNWFSVSDEIKKKELIEVFNKYFKQFQDTEVVKFQQKSGLDQEIIHFVVSQWNNAFYQFEKSLQHRNLSWIAFAALWSFYSLSVLKSIIHPKITENSKLMSENTRLCEKLLFGEEGLKVRKKWMALTDFYLNEDIPDSTVIKILKDKTSETFLSEADSLSNYSFQTNIASIFVSRFALLFLAKDKLNNELKFSEVYTRYVNYAKPLGVEIVHDRNFTASLSMAVLFLFQGNLIRHRTQKGIFLKGVVWKTNAE